MYKTFKTRIYPNKEQRQYFNECFGYYRFVYNWGLSKWYDNDCKGFNKFDYNNEYNHTINKDLEYTWIKNYNTSIKQEALLDLEVAIKAHWTNIKSKKKYSHLKFKAKRYAPRTFRMHSKSKGQFIVNGNHVSIHTCKKIKDRLEFNMAEYTNISNDDVKTIAISERNGKYYIHIIYLTEPKHNHEFKKKLIGIDLGYKNPVVSYNGKRFKSDYNFPKEKIMYLERKIKRYQNKLDNQYYGYYNEEGKLIYDPSNRFIKTKTKINKLHLRIYNIRKDWREKITTRLASKYETIKIDIPEFKLSEFNEVNKAMLRIGLYDFVNRLYDKVEYYQGNIIEMPKDYASTQICSKCNNTLKGKHKLELRDRKYHCSKCGSSMDRDENAAKNIYNLNRIRVVNVYKIRKVNVFWV